MSKQAWLDAFYSLEEDEEHADKTEEELCKLADELCADRMADKVDQMRERMKYEGTPDG